MADSIGFIGGGRITRILLGGWARAGALPRNVIVSDPDAAALERLRTAFPEVVPMRDQNERVVRQDIVFLAVHPPAMKAVLGGLRGRTGTETVIVSLAPKLTIEDLQGLLGGFDRIARVIPNAASLVGAGFNPVSFSKGLPAAARASLMRLLRVLGDAPEVPEPDLEAYAVLTAMGPTYLWFQIDELVSLGRAFGLPPVAAEEAIASMAMGAIRTWHDSGLPPGECMDLIPVRPLTDEEEGWRTVYRNRLRTVFDRLRPVAVA